MLVDCHEETFPTINWITQISQSFPRCGEKMMWSRLSTQGIHVQKQRVRFSIRRDVYHVFYVVECMMYRVQMPYGMLTDLIN